MTPTTPTTANDALRAAIPILRDADIPDPARDARLLLAHAMTIPPDRLTLHLNDPLTPNTAAHFAQLINARLTRQPVAQIIGHRLFWGRKFRVTPDVLDPRPETETLITEALKSPAKTILDLGTGTDISPAALAVAQTNAQSLTLTNRAAFTLSGWFNHIPSRYDLITSNPPYIAADEMPHLSPDVLNFEPDIALTPGGDGLDAYRAIAAGAPAHLTANGRLIVEIGPTQGPAVCALFRAAGLRNPTITKDLDHRDRVVTATHP
jgi:release factor glutamine methyltransferase